VSVPPEFAEGDEPRYLRRLVTYVRVGMADWLLAAPARSALAS